MSITWVFFFSLVKKQEVEKEERGVKQKKTKKATTNQTILIPNKTGREACAIYTAVQFLHNTDHCQIYFSFGHLSQVSHTVHSEYPDL